MPEAYPSLEIQREFGSAYLTAYYGEPVGEDDVRVSELLESVREFSKLSHLMWGVWALVRSEHSTKFDFYKYAKFRFDSYWQMIQE